jgi:preprotein translocase subunit SecG
MSIVIWLLTFVLVLLSVFLVLIVLMQKSKSDGGVGAALGGGMTEATFGADTGNMLATMTRNGAIAFFVITFGLYLAHIYQHRTDRAKTILPTIAVPAATPAAPAAPEAAVTVPEAAAPAITVPAQEAAPAAPAPATTEPAK